MRSFIAVLLGAALATGAHAAEQKLPAELLEFLGGLDAEEPGWQDYLADTDLTKVPKAPKPPAGKQVVAKPKPEDAK
jgi:hypothetical protein